jgi:hypothetical protein
MPVTVRGTDILFNNGTTQSTAAVSPSTDFGGVGSYAVLMNASNSNVAQGNTIAGSSLRHSCTTGSFTKIQLRENNSTYNGGGTALAGTWRKMSDGPTYLSSYINGYVTEYRWYSHLYVRIS